jgi:hypothetical protein
MELKKSSHGFPNAQHMPTQLAPYGVFSLALYHYFQAFKFINIFPPHEHA